MQGISPDSLTSSERLDEISEILSAGLMRLLARKSSKKAPELGEIRLDISPDQSGHPNRQQSENGP
jgi:hypothetical protein